MATKPMNGGEIEPVTLCTYQLKAQCLETGESSVMTCSPSFAPHQPPSKALRVVELYLAIWFLGPGGLVGFGNGCSMSAGLGVGGAGSG